VLVRWEKKMFRLVSEDRQRKSAVLQIVRKSVPSGRVVYLSRCNLFLCTTIIIITLLLLLLLLLLLC